MANADRYQDDTGAMQTGHMEAFCVKAKQIMNGVKLAGDRCGDPDECYMRNCVDGVCVGLVQGSYCTSHLECGLGLACLTNVCDTVLGQGVACTAGDDDQCEIGMICEAGSNRCQYAYYQNNEDGTTP